MTNSTAIRDITKNMVASLLETMSPEYYSVGAIDSYDPLFESRQCRESLFENLKLKKESFSKVCGKPKHIIHLSEELDRLIFEE